MRARALDALARRRFDLIVVGAGVNGAGIARDAAMRGLSVLLLDKGDLSAGTTQWSTRLVHGGLRYLEHAEVGLVRESLHERERLLHVAGHLVRPLPMVIPIYESDRRGPRLIRLGMAAYDALSLRKSLDHHHVLSVEELLEREPGLVPDGLKGGALYYDAQVEFPERLVVENALSAREEGALVLTYAGVERILVEENVVRGVELRDRLGGGTYTARGEVVVNAAGPWVDEVLRGVPRPSRRWIGGTKGTHVVVAPFPGAPRSALYLEAGEDARPYFVVPWNDLYLIGTTDSRYDGDLDHVEPTDEEIDYLVRETNRVLPGAGLDSTSVLYAYAGVRPLPYVEDGAAGAITRRHIVHDHAPDLAAGLVSIVGGKLTTYRSLAEEAVDLVLQRLGRRSPGSRTAEVPLPGGSAGPFEGFAATFKATSGLDEATAERLLRVYGVRATAVVAIAEGDAALGEALEGAPGSLAAEVVHAVRHEGAQTLADVLLRRTMVGLGPTAGIGPDRAAARVAQSHLGWDETRAAREVEDFRRYMRRYRPRGLAEA
ncbi:MAG: glycerol-3-phosphate dehydrogenase [Thermoleophilaceae bacterium]|nr:glycerol-3-phosphate dehydrogenase [Thermoleophilaceae bacterium]